MITYLEITLRAKKDWVGFQKKYLKMMFFIILIYIILISWHIYEFFINYPNLPNYFMGMSTGICFIGFLFFFGNWLLDYSDYKKDKSFVLELEKMQIELEKQNDNN